MVGAESSFITVAAGPCNFGGEIIHPQAGVSGLPAGRRTCATLV
jgi:hypothetical protein